jgi:uncharacterized protein (UPF0332 family)
MALADELLSVADALRRGATEGEWRRSASSAYYSAFHRIVDDSVSLVLSSVVPSAFYVRSIQHKEMMSCAKAFETPNNLAASYGFAGAVSPELQLVAANIQKLRGWRIDADYDSIKGFGQQQANDAFVAAEKLHQAAQSLRVEGDSGYVCMLAAMLLRKPEKS